VEYVRALARGGADVIELGLPFSEPIAEGPTIQAGIVRALEAWMTPARFFELADELSATVDVPLVVMTYYNLIYQYGDEEGVEPFVEAAEAAGISGVIVPDLPAEEAEPLRAACAARGLDLIFLVAPTTTDERLADVRERVSGFLYVQARLGTTGARADVSDQTHESLARLDDFELPKAVGFGISSGENAAEVVAAGADGVIVGSALVDIIAEGGDDRAEGGSAGSPTQSDDVVDRLEAKARELKEGALSGATSGPAEPERT
jgi:tryptophan synthase alpha chain